ncbi:MAG: DEAD/DEAH box helicase family protein [Spirochaetes bacterium]|nr:DEAD/DEAH box helicase family protein [Spirochaetota bacterium]
MKLYFDPNQSFQLDAVQAVIDLFEGQTLKDSDFQFSLIHEEGSLIFNQYGIGNNLIISDDDILKNLNKIQNNNGIPKNEILDGYNFSIEMETGTGKTYVYLRTIYELNKVYGFKKFVIVVPSIAIKEGVLKNLEITNEHFKTLYNNTPSVYSVYDSKNVSILRSFAASNSIEILLINIDSFAKDENVINRNNDKLIGKKPIEFIQGTNPIIIIDEPQNMETEIRKKAISNLNPLFTLRYSATHKFIYNLIYKLDPVKAYDLGLVKQIEVDSVFTENNFNQAYVSLEDIVTSKSKLLAKIKIDVNSADGVIRKVVNVDKNNYDLFVLSNSRACYEDILVESINHSDNYIELTGGIRLFKGEVKGDFQDEIIRIQIQKTIEEHFEKERKYKPLGIKVLSLFFIDRVSNYRFYSEIGNSQKGKYAKLFENIFTEISNRPNNKNIIPFDIDEIHNGYFAIDKKGILKESKENKSTEADNEAYHLIMKDKEKLLDSNTPLRFIFSHSALREGWDNPNVFQICTLNETKSEMKKRQEIGRGLRLCVNQDGNRVFDKNINKLTVIANTHYEEFAKQLQKEIEDDCGVQFKDRIKDKNQRVKLILRKGIELDQNFLDLWNKIKYKTIYNVNYDTENLIKEAASNIKNMNAISKPIIKSVKSKIEIDNEGVKIVEDGSSIHRPDSYRQIIPDIFSYIQNRTELTKDTIYQILKNSGRFSDLWKNPQMYLDRVIIEIKNTLYRLMIDGIKYEKIAGQEYEMRLFEMKEIESYISNLKKVKNENKTIFNYIELDSEIERKFANDCDDNENIEFYIKLPNWFKIDTPLGSYNPDWALIFKDEKKLYFVAETKSTISKMNLRDSERLKIECGKAHFKEFPDIDFKQVTKIEELF